MDHAKKIREQNSRHYWSDQRYGAKLFVDEGAYVFVTGRRQDSRHYWSDQRYGAKLFVDEGAYVFVTSHREEMLDKAVKEIGKNNVTGVQGDAGRDVP